MIQPITRQYKPNPAYGEHWLRGEYEVGGRITIFVINNQGNPERLELACAIDTPDKQIGNFNAIQKAIDLVNDGVEQRQKARQQEYRSLDDGWAM
jgi:hypothetical protein